MRLGLGMGAGLAVQAIGAQLATPAVEGLNSTEGLGVGGGGRGVGCFRGVEGGGA